MGKVALDFLGQYQGDLGHGNRKAADGGLRFWRKIWLKPKMLVLSPNKTALAISLQSKIAGSMSPTIREAGANVGESYSHLKLRSKKIGGGRKKTKPNRLASSEGN